MDVYVTPALVDPIETYLSVLRALKNLDHAPILGEVVNAIEDEDFDGEASNQKSNADPELTNWGHDLGSLLAHAAHYTAFACGGSSDAELKKETYDYRSNGEHVTSHIKHYLHILRGGEIVLAWPLASNAPAPVAELLACCSPAHFGDLRTQTTVLEPAVRTAMEIPVSPESSHVCVP